MNVIILHCHFDRGGVTQVVENHARSLHRSEDVGRILLVSGKRVSGLSSATQASTESLQLDDFDYDDLERPSRSVRERGRRMATRITDALERAGIDRDESVLHWHNHSLGKNTAAPAAITELAERGWKLLLQIHDFAEDNRPQNYLQLIRATDAESCQELDAYLYPCAPQIHYAGLTRADAAVMAALGIPSGQTHCLPNSVAAPSLEPVDRELALKKIRNVLGLPDKARWVLYPVRGIRRKNVGEFLLLSRLTAGDTFSGITLCPATAVENRSYQRWKRLAAEVAPRAVFDAAHHEGLTFAENLAASEFVISTSVAEGFGMAFLEPWLSGCRVIARRLPTVTADFERAGVDLTQLYDQIPVPGDKAWLQACRDEISHAFSDAWSTVPKSFRPAFDPHAGLEARQIDFARLTPARQIEVLRRVASDPSFDRSLRACSETLISNLQDSGPEYQKLIDHNADVVAVEFSVEKQAAALLRVYHRLLGCHPAPRVAAASSEQSAVDLVSQVRPFFPCRTEIPDE